ncbi:ribose-5-phosphate isomerase RpiA [Propylenella binzhouense]|uniref:Ribose-5-phosphate isomerase A n=1 Tax=Propylenella binzhouense TaxID=2555902 RepID=A0A964T368_9HYPH|nr:ribose-5-phosphate isomerase RpiA [Propylenella binzhouense]MYZ47454.1 ribose-5-phosphate isomerase RpiA [Propylenella binzhouense]
MADELKRTAAEAALSHVRNGMRIGLGTGSTAAHFVRALGRRVATGLEVVGVPTSEATAALAREAGIPLATLDDYPELDLVVDGADEIGPGLSLVKGGGAALLREKIVAYAAERMIVVADGSKLVDALGAFPLPIEIVPFGATATTLAVERAAIDCGLRCALDLRTRDGAPVVTDGGNWIVDASFGRIPDPEPLACRLSALPGVVEHGLFLDFADLALVAFPDGLKEIGA